MPSGGAIRPRSTPASPRAGRPALAARSRPRPPAAIARAPPPGARAPRRAAPRTRRRQVAGQRRVLPRDAAEQIIAAGPGASTSRSASSVDDGSLRSPVVASRATYERYRRSRADSSVRGTRTRSWSRGVTSPAGAPAPPRADRARRNPRRTGTRARRGPARTRSGTAARAAARTWRRSTPSGVAIGAASCPARAHQLGRDANPISKSGGAASAMRSSTAEAVSQGRLLLRTGRADCGRERSPQERHELGDGCRAERARRARSRSARGR